MVRQNGGGINLMSHKDFVDVIKEKHPDIPMKLYYRGRDVDEMTREELLEVVKETAKEVEYWMDENI